LRLILGNTNKLTINKQKWQQDSTLIIKIGCKPLQRPDVRESFLTTMRKELLLPISIVRISCKEVVRATNPVWYSLHNFIKKATIFTLVDRGVTEYGSCMAARKGRPETG
jgi:hypothetical protein